MIVFQGDLPPTPAELEDGMRDADGVLCLLTDRIDATMLDQAPGLSAISNYAVGCDNIDVAAAYSRGIAVGVTPDVLTEATADLAFALLLASARRICEAARDVSAGRWRTWEPRGWLGADVHGKTLVVVGGGRIGRAMAARAAGFSMRVILVGRDDDLYAALRLADFVSLHVPLRQETERLIDAEALRAMKQGAILVNTARGPIIDQLALRNALSSGHLAAAALDVTEPEPLPADEPLMDAPNLLVVPHIGSATRAVREQMAEMAVENLLHALNGQPMPFPAPDR